MMPSFRLGCGRSAIGAATGVDSISGLAHSGVSGIGGALSAESSSESTSSPRLPLPLAAGLDGLSTANRSLSALSSLAEAFLFFEPGSSLSSLSMNLSSPCLTGGGGAAAAVVSSLDEISLALPLPFLPDPESSSGSVGKATSPPRLLVWAFGAGGSLAAAAAALSFSRSAFSEAALLMAWARAILSSSPRLSSGPITESSHWSCLSITLSSLRASADFLLPDLDFGSAACTGDQAPSKPIPARAAQTTYLDRIDATSTWG